MARVARCHVEVLVAVGSSSSKAKFGRVPASLSTVEAKVSRSHRLFVDIRVSAMWVIRPPRMKDPPQTDEPRPTQPDRTASTGDRVLYTTAWGRTGSAITAEPSARPSRRSRFGGWQDVEVVAHAHGRLVDLHHLPEVDRRADHHEVGVEASMIFAISSSWPWL